MLDKLKKELRENGDKERAEHSKRFFKTGKGEYGEGDVFLGLKVPDEREIVKKYDLDFEDVQKLLDSDIHEERFAGLLILISRYKNKKADDELRREIFDFYLKNAKKGRINNWDLVDLSCHKVVGAYLVDKDRDVLYELVKGNLWEKRIAIISCFAFIKNNDFKDALKISELLFKDKHDLIHKAVGWVLREVGKKNQSVEEDFLKKHYKTMPRTMLRYAIERFDEGLRKKYLGGEV